MQKKQTGPMIIMPEMIGYLAATLTTASFLPQAILTIRTKDTESLSLSMYSLFTLGVFCWLVYGVYISDKAIIFANAITLVLATSILFLRFIMCCSRKVNE
jgi:MtN3 and saliva related transmembrane protein